MRVTQAEFPPLPGARRVPGRRPPRRGPIGGDLSASLLAAGEGEGSEAARRHAEFWARFDPGAAEREERQAARSARAHRDFWERFNAPDPEEAAAKAFFAELHAELTAVPEGVGHGAIARRHRLRRAAGRIVGGRVARCGRYRCAQVVSLYRTERGAFARGVETCGSIWACPVCAAKISEGRREELAELLRRHVDHGGASYMATLTAPHAKFDRAGDLRQLVATAWRKVQGGAPWSRMLAAFGVLGQVRALEVTHGANGWHPHLHVLILTAAPLSPAEQRELHRRIWARWAAKVAQLGGGECVFAASDFRPATASDYVAKWGADSELAKAVGKISRKGGRSPWQLIADADAGDRQAAALFAEYAEAFKGARHLTFTHGLRERYGLRAPEDDLQLAEQLGEQDPELPIGDGLALGKAGDIDGRSWDEIGRAGLTGEVVEACAIGGWPAVVAFLRKHRVGAWDYERRPDAPPEWHGRRYRDGYSLGWGSPDVAGVGARRDARRSFRIAYFAQHGRAPEREDRRHAVGA